MPGSIANGGISLGSWALRRGILTTSSSTCSTDDLESYNIRITSYIHNKEISKMDKEL